jgi:nucleoside-diphosphate-sugar epimerase
MPPLLAVFQILFGERVPANPVTSMFAEHPTQYQRVLVTGGTGFIGQQLLTLLAQTPLQVRLALRSATAPVTPRLEAHQLEANKLETQKPETIVVGELGPDTDWQAALVGVDAIVHLAGRAHMLKDWAPDPAAEFQRVNCAGTLNLARQAIAAGVKQFIFISSIGAVTTLSRERLTEATPCRPDTDYGRSKYDAEVGLRELCQGTAMTWTILRPTLVYGPGNPGNMERLLKLIQTGLPLPLGSLPNQRSFVYVGNLVAAILRCLEHPAAAGQVFLISDGEDFSTPALVKVLAQGLGKSALLLPCPPALLQLLGRVTGQTKTIERLMGSLVVDSSKLRQTLDWHPPFPAAEGLQTTARWFQSQKT